MEWAAYATRCGCHCHAYSGVTNDPDVDVRDPLHAALACDTCRHVHSPALLDAPMAPPDPPRPASFCWEPPEGSE